MTNVFLLLFLSSFYFVVKKKLKFLFKKNIERKRKRNPKKRQRRWHQNKRKTANTKVFVQLFFLLFLLGSISMYIIHLQQTHTHIRKKRIERKHLQKKNKCMVNERKRREAKTRLQGYWY